MAKPKTYQQYLDYIKSDAWIETKKRYWKSQRYDILSKNPNWKIKCGACRIVFDSKKGLHVHHLIYRNFGNERTRDLIHLCESCHDKLHTIARSHKITMFKNGNFTNDGSYETLYSITKDFCKKQRKQKGKIE